MMIVRNVGLGALPANINPEIFQRMQQMTLTATADAPSNPLQSLLDAITGGSATGAAPTTANLPTMTVAKPWYKTWWGVALIVGGAYGGYRLVTR